MTFEEMYVKLENVTKKLDDKDVSLEESIALYNKGIELSKKCLESLNESKGKILLLTDELKKLTEEFSIDLN